MGNRFIEQIQEVVSELNDARLSFALIGGLALASHKVVRATQDMEDIRALMRENRDSLDQDELREYFKLFDREPLLDELLEEAR